MAESSFSKVPLSPLAQLPVVNSTEVDGFFQASTQLEATAQKNFENNVVAEAERQGIVDGQQGKFNTELLYAPTYRGKAYTRAAQNSFLQTVELNASKKIQELILANPTDHVAAKQQINGYLNGVVQGFPGAIKERLGQTFLLKSQIRANVGLSGIQNRERRQFANQAEVDALAKDNQRSKDIVANAENIFDPDAKISLQSVAAVIEQRTQIKSDYEAKITDPEGVEIAAHNPAFRERALQQFDIDTSNAAIKSSFNRSNNKEEFLRQFEANEIDLIVKDETGGTVLDLRPDVRRKSALINYMQAEISRENVKRNAELRIFRGQVKGAVNALKAGGNITEEDIALLKTRAHQLQDEETFNVLSDWVSHSNDMHMMSVMTPSNLDAIVGQERAAMENKRDAGEAITKTDVDQLEAKEALLNNMSTQLEQDPLEWANTVGLIEKTPIIPTAQETIEVNGQEFRPQELMNSRIAQAEAVGAHYGRPPKFLTEEEKTTFQKFLTDRNTSPDAKLSLLASLSGFGDRQDEVLAEISPKAPEYMHIAGLMTQGTQPSILSDAMEGLAIIQGAGTIKGTRVLQTNTAEVADITDEVLGVAYRESPQTRKQVVNVAEAIYTARMFRKGKTDSSDFDEDEWQRALQESSGANFVEGTQFGGVTEYNGEKVHVPSWMETDEFEDFINELTDEDWRVGGFGGAPIFPKANGEADPASMTKEIDIFSDLNLISIGNGQYIVARNKGDEDPKFYRAQVDPTSPVGAVRNGFYVLDLNKIPSDRRTRALAGAKSFFVTPEEVEEQRKKEKLREKKTGVELVPGPRSFSEDVEKVGEVLSNLVDDLTEAVTVDPAVAAQIKKDADEFVKNIKQTIKADSPHKSAQKKLAEAPEKFAEFFNDAEKVAGMPDDQFDEFVVFTSSDQRSEAVNVEVSRRIREKTGIDPDTFGRGDEITAPEVKTKADVKKKVGEVADKLKLTKNDADLFRAVIQTESNFRPQSASSAGAQGPAQIMPGTAQLIADKSGLGFTAKEILDNPAKNLAAGAWLLFSDHLPFWTRKGVDDPEAFALAEYNSNRATVGRAIKKAKSKKFTDIVKFLPEETQKYVPKVRGNKK